MSKHAQSTQNNNLAISMQYLNKDERDRLRSMFLKRTHFGIECVSLHVENLFFLLGKLV